MKYIEIFSGIGGMGYGLMQAGMKCVGYCEIDKYAHKAFQILHDPEERMWRAYDVRSVTDDDIRTLGRERGPIQLIAAGFPCQAFSIAGKRQGFADSTRGTLFFEIVRFASILRPKYLLLENVTGLLNHDNGRTFETIIRTLDELGYVGEWCVLNSSAYVPQNRERVFIVASLGGSSGRKVFPFGRENENSIKVDRESILIDDQGRLNKDLKLLDTCPTLRAKSHGNEPKVLVNVANGQLQIRESNISNFLDANYFKGLDNHQGRTGVLEPIPVLTPDREEKRQNGRRFKDPGEPAFTLTAHDRHGVAVSIDLKSQGSSTRRGVIKEDRVGALDTNCNIGVTQGYRIRKLTPLECFRLQSWPDEWYYKLKGAGISDSQLYKMAGNGVTSVVAYEIGRRIMDNAA